MNTQHTATPWIQIEGDRFSKEVVITTEERVKNSIGPICEMDVHYTGPMGNEQPANAEFIVRACNTHDDLVGALKGLIKAGHTLDSSSREWNAAHAALAKAGAA